MDSGQELVHMEGSTNFFNFKLTSSFLRIVFQLQGELRGEFGIIAACWEVGGQMRLYFYNFPASASHFQDTRPKAPHRFAFAGVVSDHALGAVDITAIHVVSVKVFMG
ncbi:hypothetical protein PC116_g17201 [Phytophthora cactorum]|nr:hypothetical protein PC114_g14220 [Phytophthora cactorum]KAG4055558.1 hypothetical protein PC123_g9347 [Phytophthora cactorum]KAG4234647.1 hypothetical protein PC116_g17201 [Phytophthora cactorum]